MNSLTRSLYRFVTLLDALREGPQTRADLFVLVSDAYPVGPSMRPMIDRDVRALRELGIVIEISRTRPPIYTLRGGAPLFDEREARLLGLIRDTFGDRHPQATQVQALLARLTARLSPEAQAAYERRQATRAPLQPAIDYTPYAATIAQLEHAISGRRQIAFAYHAGGRARATRHERIEPYDIEFYDRHFYLVAYAFASHQMLDFRIDRITPRSLELLDRVPPGAEHQRTPVVFRYRLAAPLARGELSQRFERQRVVERLPNGDVVIEAEDGNAFFIVRTLLKYGPNAELLDPPALVEEMRKTVRALYGLYFGESAANPAK